MNMTLIEPDYSFYLANAKLAWSDGNIVQLKTFYNRLMEEHPCKFSFERDEKGIWAVRCAPDQLIPADIVLWAGDIIHNLRSCLDICWMGLWRSVEPSRAKGTFPRGHLKEELAGTIDKIGIERSFPGAKALIVDKMKPYRDGNRMVWLTAQFDNWNKHSMLIFGVFATTFIELIATSRTIKRVELNGSKIVGNIKGIAFGIPPNDKFEIQGTPKVTMEIMIGTGELAPEYSLIPTLEAMAAETRKCVELFVSSFGSELK
jgi:hypothetical protein